MEHLEGIHGVGGVKAKGLHKRLIKLSGKSTDELDEMSKDEIYDLIIKSGLINELPIAGQVDIIERPESVTWEQIDQLNDFLKKKIKGIRWIIAGGYRRKKPVSNDIDIVLDKGNYEDVWHEFMRQVLGSSEVFFYEPYAVGPSKVSTLVDLRFGMESTIVRVDIFLAETNEWICAVLFATGSGLFNIRMRAQAKRLGYKLNQKYLMKDGNIIEATEREIFDILGMTWKEPEDRVR